MFPVLMEKSVTEEIIEYYNVGGIETIDIIESKLSK